VPLKTNYVIQSIRLGVLQPSSLSVLMAVLKYTLCMLFGLSETLSFALKAHCHFEVAYTHIVTNITNAIGIYQWNTKLETYRSDYYGEDFSLFFNVSEIYINGPWPFPS